MRRRIAEIRSFFLYSYHEPQGADAFHMVLRSLEIRKRKREREGSGGRGKEKGGNTGEPGAA